MNSNASYHDFDIHSRSSISFPLWSFFFFPSVPDAPKPSAKIEETPLSSNGYPSHLSHFLGFILSQLMTPAFRVTFLFRSFLS